MHCQGGASLQRPLFSVPTRRLLRSQVRIIEIPGQAFTVLHTNSSLQPPGNSFAYYIYNSNIHQGVVPSNKCHTYSYGGYTCRCCMGVAYCTTLCTTKKSCRHCELSLWSQIHLQFSAGWSHSHRQSNCDPGHSHILVGCTTTLDACACFFNPSSSPPPPPPTPLPLLKTPSQCSSREWCTTRS